MQPIKTTFQVFAAALLLAPMSSALATVVNVEIGDDFFSPAEITVAVGDTVRWTHIGTDGDEHTTTSDTNPGWDSGPMVLGDTFEYQFTRSGSWRYHCNFHPTIMHGIVNVGGPIMVHIFDDSFNPALITVNVGDVVRWTNLEEKGDLHTTTSNTGIWDSGPLEFGDSFEYQFNRAGTFRYHCEFHPTIMHGIVNVRAAEQDAIEAKGNFPNPFNPSTDIQYALNEESHVTLKIFNTLGQEIATLVNETQTPGIKSVVWNGKNQYGEVVSSGIYFYRIQAGELVLTQKMMFMK